MVRATNPSKPRGQRPAWGGFASVRAATRVKPEQASKGKVRAPSPLSKDEGRRGRPDAPTRDGRPARRGSGRSTYARGDSQHGKPVGLSGRPGNASIGRRARQASEGSYEFGGEGAARGEAARISRGPSLSPPPAQGRWVWLPAVSHASGVWDAGRPVPGILSPPHSVGRAHALT